MLSYEPRHKVGSSAEHRKMWCDSCPQLARKNICSRISYCGHPWRQNYFRLQEGFILFFYFNDAKSFFNITRGKLPSLVQFLVRRDVGPNQDFHFENSLKITKLSKSESVKFLLIESVIRLFTDSPAKKYISLLNQLIITN